MDRSRTQLLVGQDGIQKLTLARVALFGLGGVGGYALEALVRAGIGTIFIFDHDRFTESNLNRQILATCSSVGMYKTDVAAERARSINPDVNIIASRERVTPENAVSIIPADAGYAIDAIDEISSKVSLLAALAGKGIPLVSSMGSGSKLDTAGIKIADIAGTTHCPLARTVRKKLKALGIESGIRCVYSEENLGTTAPPEQDGGKRLQGTISYVPGLFGLTAAGAIIREILENDSSQG